MVGALKPPAVIVVDAVVDAGMPGMVIVVERSPVDPDYAPIDRRHRSQLPCMPCHSWTSRGSRPSGAATAR